MCGTKQCNTISKMDRVAPSEMHQYCLCPTQRDTCMDKPRVESRDRRAKHPLICEGWQSAPLGGESIQN